MKTLQEKIKQDFLIKKGKKVPVGTVTGDYKKVAEGKWEKVGKDKSGKQSKELKEHKKIFDPFIKIALKVKDENEFVDKVRGITNVPRSTAEAWGEKYGVNEGVTIFGASKRFIEDVKSGKYD